MLTLQELLNGVKCLDENTLAELSDKLWELGTLDDIKEKVTPECELCKKVTLNTIMGSKTS